MHEEFLTIADAQRLADEIGKLSRRLYDLENRESAFNSALLSTLYCVRSRDPSLVEVITKAIRRTAHDNELEADKEISRQGHDVNVANEAADRYRLIAADLRRIVDLLSEPSDGPRPSHTLTVIDGGKS